MFYPKSYHHIVLNTRKRMQRRLEELLVRKLSVPQLAVRVSAAYLVCPRRDNDAFVIPRTFIGSLPPLRPRLQPGGASPEAPDRESGGPVPLSEECARASPSLGSRGVWKAAKHSKGEPSSPAFIPIRLTPPAAHHRFTRPSPTLPTHFSKARNAAQGRRTKLMA